MVFADDVLETVSQSPVISESDITIDSVAGAKKTEAIQGSDVVTIDDVSDVLDAYYRSQRDNLPEIGRPRVALVLSGGGAKGIAHIPIIEALEKYGIPIDKVYGTSMGALIGGLYCAGYSPKE
ncbi:MAG: patatin-like phospholipase family protein, partial [Spirochaetales bacterium]|nr:patatin-like phospholipase family protein [Spirochaetales bacterium]